VGLQNAIDFFQVRWVFGLEQLTQKYEIQVHTLNIITDIAEMQENARKRHQEVLDLVEAFLDSASSDRASSVRGFHSL
jgi:hypothetical protein